MKEHIRTICSVLSVIVQTTLLIHIIHSVDKPQQVTITQPAESHVVVSPEVLPF